MASIDMGSSASGLPGATLTRPIPDSALKSWCLLVVALGPGLIMGLTMTLVAPVMPAIAAHFGADEDARLFAQYFMAISGVGVTIGAPIAGILVDRFGCRPVLIVSLAIFSLAGLSTVVTDGVPALLSARFLVGFGAGAFMAAGTALIGQYWHGPSRATLVGFVSGFGAALAFLSVMAAGAVGHAYGWRAPFVGFGLGLPMILLVLAVPAEARKVQTSSKQVQGQVDWSEWRPLMPVFLSALLLYIVFFVPMTQLPLILPEIGVTDHRQSSLILALPTVFACMTGFGFGYINRILGPRRVQFALISLYALGITVMGATNSASMTVVAVILCGLGMGMMPPHFAHESLAHSTVRIRGRATSIAVAIHYITQFFNSVLIGTLGANIGLRQALLVTGGVFIVWMIAAMPKAIAAKPKPAV